VSAKDPFFHFFFFLNNAGLECEGCVLELSCGARGVNYFNEVLQLVRSSSCLIGLIS
jgi:hypothetical protein